MCVLCAVRKEIENVHTVPSFYRGSSILLSFSQGKGTFWSRRYQVGGQSETRIEKLIALNCHLSGT